MSFCGVWAGFCFVNLTDERGDPLTRITNGIIEKCWGCPKESSTDQNQTPVDYTNNTLDKTRCQAENFMEEMKSDVNSSDSDKEDEFDKQNHKGGCSKKKSYKLRAIRNSIIRVVIKILRNSLAQLPQFINETLPNFDAYAKSTIYGQCLSKL